MVVKPRSDRLEAAAEQEEQNKDENTNIRRKDAKKKQEMTGQNNRAEKRSAKSRETGRGKKTGNEGPVYRPFCCKTNALVPVLVYHGKKRKNHCKHIIPYVILRGVTLLLITRPDKQQTYIHKYMCRYVGHVVIYVYFSP